MRLCKNQIILSSFLFIMICFASVTTGYADGAAAAQKVKQLEQYLYPVVIAIGDLLMILGVWKFGTAMASDQAEQLSKGIAELATGAILANIKLIMGDTSGLDDVMSILTTIIQVIGGVVTAYGGLSLGLGFAQDNSENISKGVKFFIAGIIIFSVGTIKNWIAVK